MNLLLDTHALLWWLLDSDRLRGRAYDAIADAHNAVFVSAATVWEIAIKAGLGKLDVPPDLTVWLPSEFSANQFAALPIHMSHALGVERLPNLHADPFDRLLIAQAIAEGLTLVTADQKIERYDVRVLRC